MTVPLVRLANPVRNTDLQNTTIHAALAITALVVTTNLTKQSMRVLLVHTPTTTTLQQWNNATPAPKLLHVSYHFKLQINKEFWI